MKTIDHANNQLGNPSKTSTSFNRHSKETDKKTTVNDRRKSSQLNFLMNSRDGYGARRETSNISKL